MILTNEQLRLTAKLALKERVKADIPIDHSFCIVDLASSLGVEVKYVDLTSLEGAYFKESPAIMMSSHRPDGRTRFTCAHELGHHVFDHGDHFDELVENINKAESKTEEALADSFARFILMPKSTVTSGFLNRGYDITSPTPEQLYSVASWLGVGYTTLLYQMHFTLRRLSTSQFVALKKVAPAKIKKDLCGFKVPGDLYVYDEAWKGRPVDLSVGDYLLLRNGSIENHPHLSKTEVANIYQAVSPGEHEVTIYDTQGETTIRVMRQNYSGRAKFRYLQEV